MTRTPAGAGGPPLGRQEPHEPRGADERVGTWGLVRRTVAEFQEDGLTDWAAALTHCGLLSLFPALLAIAAGRWAASSCSSSGPGSPTWPCCSAPS